MKSKTVWIVVVTVLILSTLIAANLKIQKESFEENPSNYRMIYSDKHDIVGNTMIGPGIMPVEKCLGDCITNANCVGVLTQPTTDDSQVYCWIKGRDTGIDDNQTLITTPFCITGTGENRCSSYVKKPVEQLLQNK